VRAAYRSAVAKEMEEAMLVKQSQGSQGTVSVNQKLEPRAKLPTAEVLRTFSEEDVKLLKLTLSSRSEYIDHPLFADPEMERWLLAPIPDANTGTHGADDSGAYALEDDANPLKRYDREQRFFLQLNYHRRHVYRVLEAVDGRRLNAQTAGELLRWQRRVEEIRGQIVRDNVALVLAMAKRTRISGVDISDLISEGNLALLRAVHKFDCARGYKFSTYACRAILKSFSRVATRTSRYRGHFPAEFDPVLEKSNHLEQRRADVEDACVDELRSILDGNLGNLSEVERTVIQARFALNETVSDDKPTKGKTLEQVGELIGVTKERVRQIQNKALVKLRLALDQTVLT
jgi:RNA polymerase primary sigma factor